jgi:integrase
MSVKVREIYPGSWYLRISYQNIRKTKKVGTKERAVELQKKLTTALELYGLDALKVIEENHEREIRKATNPLPKIEEFSGQWLEELEKTDLKRSTKENYAFLINKHIVPEFGDMRLDALDYARIKRCVIRKSAKYSKDTMRLMIAVLRSMIQEAVNEGILQTNPVVKLGKFYCKARKLKSKIDPLTLEELHQIEEKCREKFPEYYGFILCMARTGMRIGEVTGLQWQDIDFKNNYIVVQRNIPHHRQVETTKTEASQRKVDMSPELAAELIRLRTEQKKQVLAEGTTFDAEEWIFRN